MIRIIRNMGAILMCLVIVACVTAARDPHEQPNDNWISLTGTVVSVAPDSFELDYGDGRITVKMDDWDWYREGRDLLENERVTVNGRVDESLLKGDSIKADSVFVGGMNTYFYACSTDEEAVRSRLPAVITGPPEACWLNYSGKVTAINGREFTLDAGKRMIRVDTGEMDYNPLDDKGYQKIKNGDWVKVYGQLNRGVFKNRKIMAEIIISLKADKTKK